MKRKHKTIKIAIYNEKGGCGKTSTAMNLAAGLAKLGYKVLLADFDPQHHLSNWLGFSPDGNPTTTDLIFNTISGIGVEHQTYIRHNHKEQLDYIPTTKLLSGMLGIIATINDSANLLSNIFSDDFFHKYDYIIFDCQTALDLLVSNVLKACDKLLIPVQADKLAYDAVVPLTESFMRIKNDTDIRKYLIGMLVTMYQSNTRHSALIYNALKESYGDLVFNTYISHRTEAKNAYGQQQSSVIDRNSTVGQQYLEIAKIIAEVCSNE